MSAVADFRFMFAFAAFLSHVRKCSRPGAMFFVRDPSDPSFSPVKEIVEKPAMTQLRKVGPKPLVHR
jgi:E3 ubiquitin-protein ligase MARCH6